MLAEPRAELLDQAAAMPRLFVAHAVEHGRPRRGSPGRKPSGIIGINAFVFFFEGNGQRENFAFERLSNERISFNYLYYAPESR